MKPRKYLIIIILILCTFFIVAAPVMANPAYCQEVLDSRLIAELRGILNIFRIVAPLLVVAFSIYEFLGAILSKDAERLKEANSRLMKRMLLVVLLFVLPILIDLILGIIDGRYTTCIYYGGIFL